MAAEDPRLLSEGLPEPSGRLAEDLAAAFAGRVAVPGDVDAAVLAAAHRHLGAVRRRRWLARRVLPAGAAAAAAIVLCIWLADPFAAADPADLDRNGRVDILDAFALARSLQSHATTGDTVDLNRDGVVDAADVEAIARRAVALAPAAATERTSG